MRAYPNIPLEKVRGKKPTWWRVTSPVMCYDTDGSRYVIPAGFVSNFASIPRILFLFFAPHGLSAIPSIKHDYRYIHLIGVEKHGFWKARAAADRQYRLDLLDEGMGCCGAWLMWLGVRALGWYNWGQHLFNRALELLSSP